LDFTSRFRFRGGDGSTTKEYDSELFGAATIDGDAADDLEDNDRLLFLGGVAVVFATVNAAASFTEALVTRLMAIVFSSGGVVCGCCLRYGTVYVDCRLEVLSGPKESDVG